MILYKFLFIGAMKRSVFSNCSLLSSSFTANRPKEQWVSLL